MEQRKRSDETSDTEKTVGRGRPRALNVGTRLLKEDCSKANTKLYIHNMYV